MVAIITGASSGLGREIAVAFAAKGWNCVLAARSADKLAALQSELTEKFGGDHLVVPTDLSSPSDVEKLFRETVGHYGEFHVLVNNAGDTYLWPLVKHGEERIQKLIDLLVRANTLTHHFALQGFKSSGGKGIVLDVLSSAAQEAYRHNPVYGAAKEYVRALSVRNGLDEPGITFIRLYPSNIRTPLVNEETASPEVWEEVKKAYKLDPRDVAKVALALVEKGESADVYMEQTENGPRVDKLDFPPAVHTPIPELKSLL